MFAAIWYSMPTKHKRGQNEIQFPPYDSGRGHATFCQWVVCRDLKTNCDRSVNFSQCKT
jgi:hypothetical protein